MEGRVTNEVKRLKGFKILKAERDEDGDGGPSKDEMIEMMRKRKTISKLVASALGALATFRF